MLPQKLQIRVCSVISLAVLNACSGQVSKKPEALTTTKIDQPSALLNEQQIAKKLANNNLLPQAKWSAFSAGNALTPPMGWNSWNAFHTRIDEQKLLSAAQNLIDYGLADLGYRYINIDDGWWLKREQQTQALVVRSSIFPSSLIEPEGTAAEKTSFKPIVDKIHQLGLKAGIYTDIGQYSCSQAWNLSSPNLPEGSQRERQVGLYGHINKDIPLFFEKWGFDYIKVDACGLTFYDKDRPTTKEYDYQAFEPYIDFENINRTKIDKVTDLYETLSTALVKANPDNDFVYAICNWGTANVRAWGKNLSNQWRTSGDLIPTWSRLLHNFDSAVSRAIYAGPGTWNDPDMLIVGKGEFDENHLVEAKSHFTLWSMINAPLLIGYDITKLSDELVNIISNPDLISFNQDPAGHQAVLAYTSDDIQILVKTLNKRGEKAVALFNRGLTPLTVQLTAEHLKMAADKNILLQDVWQDLENITFKNETEFHLKPRQTLAFKVTGTPELATGMYLSELPGQINVAEDGITALRPDPNVHRMIDMLTNSTRISSRGYYAGWGGPRLDSTVYDENIRLDGQYYPNGVSVLANSRLEVKNLQGFNHFSATVGLDDSSLAKNSPVVFAVYADGKKVKQTPALRFNDKPLKITADIKQAKLIELVAYTLDHAQLPSVVAWADAKLY